MPTATDNSVRAQKAAVAALKHAKKAARSLHEQIESLQDHQDRKASMPKIRATLAELTQRVHEFNAYSNIAQHP